MNSSAGLGFLCKLGDLQAKTRQGKDFMDVGEGVRAQRPYVLEASSKNKFVAALSSDSRLLLFPLDEVPVRPNGGVGVQLIGLPEGVTLASVGVTDGKSLVVSGLRRKNRASETMDGKQLAEHVGKRAQRGKLCDVGLKPVERIGE